MNQARLSRNRKRQLGQFLTPPKVATAIVESIEISPKMRVLEPSLGNGSFIFALLAKLKRNISHNQLIDWASKNIYGVELDEKVMNQFEGKWKDYNFGPLPETFQRKDFFQWLPPTCCQGAALCKQTYFQCHLEYFDLIVGNPPFGGSFDPQIEDNLDSIFGMRNSMKIKKETYSFFLLKCLDMLKPEGCLCFICSDTILTISTMRGIRHYLQENCDVQISAVPGEFEETTQNMVLIKLTKLMKKPPCIKVLDNEVPTNIIEITPNLSWRINADYARYFSGETLGDYMVATSGMTIGNNELFQRKINNGVIEEPYKFSYAEHPITLTDEIQRARLGKLSLAKQKKIYEQERRGDTRRIVHHEIRKNPLLISMPNKDYWYYNKATKNICYSNPEWAIFWKDEGEYVYTFKKSGNWYLHGVGGKPYFGREGLTWSLIATRMYTRWLPSGYILDSGSPCAFLRSGVSHDELFFIMGWTLTNLCTDILKNVINHTRNIQSKDFERLPYPVWVSSETKRSAIQIVKNLIQVSVAGQKISYDHPEMVMLEELYEYKEIIVYSQKLRKNCSPAQVSLFD